MNEAPSYIEFANIVLLNDSRTPLEFVVRTLRLVLGKSEREAREIAGVTNWLGRHGCGVYPVAVARAFVHEATKYAEASGHALHLELEPLLNTAAGEQPVCSFCGKRESDVRKLISGKRAYLRWMRDWRSTQSC